MRPYLSYAVAVGLAAAMSAVGYLFAAGGAAADPASADDNRAVQHGRAPAQRATSASAAAPQTAGDVVASAFASASANGDRTPHSFYFTRGMYTDRGRGWTPAWATDYDKADLQFLIVLRRLTNLDAYDSGNAVALDDPVLRRFPFLYMLEVGYMQLTPAEVAGLRDYMLAGGFVFIDDFWGTREWQNFEWQMQRVLPEYPIVELSLDHPLFSSFYHITELVQVPSIGTVRRYRGTRTHESDGYEPQVRGVFDDDGRLMMLINWNTDIGDAWEWAEQPDYPLKYSTFAYQIGVNAIVYAMSH